MKFAMEMKTGFCFLKFLKTVLLDLCRYINSIKFFIYANDILIRWLELMFHAVLDKFI